MAVFIRVLGFSQLKVRSGPPHPALCIHDPIPNHPPVQTVCGTYVRYHGDRHRAGNYPDQYLDTKARWIQDSWTAGNDVYADFNNEVHGHTLTNAATPAPARLGNFLALTEACLGYFAPIISSTTQVS